MADLKDTNPILFSTLSQNFPHKILKDFKIDYLRSPLQLLNSIVYAQATNPKWKPKKEYIFGQQIMYFTDYLHQVAKENMRTIKSLNLVMQDEKDGNHGFFDCTEFLKQQDSSNVENLVDRLQSAKDVGLIHPLEKMKVIQYDPEHKEAKSYYRCMLTKG